MEFVNVENKKKFGIYAIKNKINDKVYIGQTGESFYRRYLHHRWKLRKGTHDNQYLQNAFNLYGEKNFEFIVIKIVKDKDLLDEFEIKYIKQYRNNNCCYNINDGGNVSRRGISLSEETKRKIGEKNRENMLGRKLSEETKRKMSMSRTGHTPKRKNLCFTDDIVITIKQRLMNGDTVSQIANDLKTEYKNISNILSANSYKNVYVEGWNEFRKNRQTYSRLTSQDHMKIYNLYCNQHMNKYELAKMYDKNVKTIEYILRKQRKLAS